MQSHVFKLLSTGDETANQVFSNVQVGEVVAGPTRCSAMCRWVRWWLGRPGVLQCAGG